MVLPTCTQGRGVKSFDGGAARRIEAEVQARSLIRGHGVLGGNYPEGNGIGTVTQRGDRLAEAAVAKGLQGGIIEALGLGNVAYTDRYVIDHAEASCLD